MPEPSGTFTCMHACIHAHMHAYMLVHAHGERKEKEQNIRCCAGVGELQEAVAAKAHAAASISAQLETQQQQSAWEGAQHTAKELQSVHEGMQELERAVATAKGADVNCHSGCILTAGKTPRGEHVEPSS